MPDFIIVSFLKEAPSTFKRAEWPLHVTVVGMFRMRAASGEIEKTLAEVAPRHAPIMVMGKSREMYGRDLNIPVTELESSEALEKLHLDLVGTLGTKISLKVPSFSRDGFRPHVTEQKEGRLVPGDTATLTNFSLVELNREIGKTHATFSLGK